MPTPTRALLQVMNTAPKPAARPYRVMIRLSEEEQLMFDRVAERMNLPVAALLRMLVKSAEARLDLQMRRAG
jgi:hypothetical protein